jgi:hypothetical protein
VLSANGAKAVALNYDKSATNFDWAVVDGAGVLACGAREAGFYDNFALTPAGIPSDEYCCPSRPASKT